MSRRTNATIGYQYLSHIVPTDRKNLDVTSTASTQRRRLRNLKNVVVRRRGVVPTDISGDGGVHCLRIVMTRALKPSDADTSGLHVTHKRKQSYRDLSLPIKYSTKISWRHRHPTVNDYSYQHAYKKYYILIYIYIFILIKCAVLFQKIN